MPRERLWSWVHGEEDDEKSAAEISSHVESCERCSDSVAQMRALLSDLDDLAGDDTSAPVMPETIGEYRILRKLGEGGMGVVFEAQQETPRRKVALKVIRGGQFTDEFRVRLFQREMHSLARLNHPAIASIYGAGRTDDGLHFFAMELVEGVPLTRFLRPTEPATGSAQQTIRDTLQLFHNVCAGLSYAHQRGVVHRDLKPSNILVKQDGQPKILDFGLARMSADEAGDAPALTMAHETGRFMGTLQYASPEQAEGNADLIDVRTDVYALGVILYELLTGELPYDAGGRSLRHAIRIIQEGRPATKPLIDAGVPYDVRVIILKCLEKEPQRRYQSAAELAEDVQRYLTDHPIKARPPSRIYRARKMIARHRVTFGLLALIVLVIGASVVSLRHERDQARREADKFKRMNDILVDFIAAPNPWRQGTVDTRVIDVLDAVAAGIEHETRDHPLVGAALYYTLGFTYAKFSRFDDAEHCLRRALAIREKQLGRDNLETIHVINDLGELLYEKGDLDAAESLLREAYEVRARRLPAVHADLAQSINSIGLVLKQRGRHDEAADWLTQALAMRERIAADSRRSADREARADAFNAVAQTQNNLAGLLRQRAKIHRAAGSMAEADRDLQQAHDLYLSGLEIRTNYLGESHPEVAKMHNNYAKCLQDLGKPAEAEEHFRESLRILREGLGDEHIYIARAMCNLAEVLLLMDRPADARELLESALRMQQRLLGPDHSDVARTRELLDGKSAAPPG